MQNNIEKIVNEFFTQNNRLDEEKVTWDWTSVQQRKYLLYLSNLSLLVNIKTMERQEKEELVFFWIDTINLLHRPCSFSDTEAKNFFNETRLGTLIDNVHKIVDTLAPEQKIYGCEAKWLDWTEDQHKRYLLFLCNELLHLLTGKVVAWNSFDDDFNSQNIFRSLFPFYAGKFTRLYQGVLRLIANNYSMYRRVVFSIVLVLGYLAPFEQRDFFRNVSKEGLIPGSCEEDKDELLEMLGHYVLAWFYNDASSHNFLQDTDVGDVEMPRWDTVPENEEQNIDAHKKALVSIYSYYTPLDKGPKYSYGSLFCVGRDGFHKVLCDPEAYPPENPDIPPDETWIPIPEGSLTGAPEAMLHSIGQMAHGLSHTEGKLDHILLQDFRQYVRVAPTAASYLIDVARNSETEDSRLKLMTDLLQVVKEEEISDDLKTKLVARLEFEVNEIKRPADKFFAGLNDTKISLYVDEAKNEQNGAIWVADFLANINDRIQTMIKKLDDPTAFTTDENILEKFCDKNLVQILQKVSCPDKFFDFTAFNEGQPHEKNFWTDYGFNFFLGDLDVSKALSKQQKQALTYMASGNKIGMIEYAEKFNMEPKKAQKELTDLESRGILDKTETNDKIEYSLKEKYQTDGTPKTFEDV